jgi:hypothetical protein
MAKADKPTADKPTADKPTADKPADVLRESALLKKLLERGGENAVALRGFIGPATREGHVRLFPRLVDLTQSMEIARADILHALPATGSPDGPVVLWVKRDAQIQARNVNAAEAVTQGAQKLVEIRKGRLRMKARAPQEEPICFSVCMDCLSWCSCSICSTQPL